VATAKAIERARADGAAVEADRIRAWLGRLAALYEDEKGYADKAKAAAIREVAARIEVQEYWPALDRTRRPAAKPPARKRRWRCQDCKQVRDDVKRTTCPYQEDVIGRKVPATLCRECRRARAAEI